MRKATGSILVILTCLLLLAGCADRGSSTVSAAPVAQPTPDPPPAAAPTPSNSFTVSGPLIVEHQLDILAQREGILSKLPADTGGRVRTGDLLAQLDDRQLQADLEAARAKTRSTEADLKNW